MKINFDYHEKCVKWRCFCFYNQIRVEGDVLNNHNLAESCVVLWIPLVYGLCFSSICW